MYTYSDMPSFDVFFVRRSLYGYDVTEAFALAMQHLGFIVDVDSEYVTVDLRNLINSRRDDVLRLLNLLHRLYRNVY